MGGNPMRLLHSIRNGRHGNINSFVAFTINSSVEIPAYRRQGFRILNFDDLALYFLSEVKNA
jgi:hypothetical protein